MSIWDHVKTYAEYHSKAQPLLEGILKAKVTAYNTLCSCNIKGKTCEVVFKGKAHQSGDWICDEVIATIYIPGVPRTPNNFKTLAFAVDADEGIGSVCNKVGEGILKAINVVNIVVKKQANNWLAYVESKIDFRGVGNSAREAIGDLVMNHRDQFGVTEIQTRN
jgi:hypothetical protein